MGEEWRQVFGFEGSYEVSSRGNVRSIPRKRVGRWGNVLLIPGRPIKKRLMNAGYLSVSLKNSGIRKTAFVHRLVAEAFLGPRDGMQVNHLDGNKTNNKVSNLEWVTPSENVMHAIKKGLVSAGISDEHMASMRSKRKRRVVVDGVGRFPTVTEAASAIGVPESSLCSVLRGRYRSTHGYTASYEGVCNE